MLRLSLGGSPLSVRRIATVTQSSGSSPEKDSRPGFRADHTFPGRIFSTLDAISGCAIGVFMEHDYKTMVRIALYKGRRPKIKGFGRPRWAIACDLFCIGGAAAERLCRDLGLDPDELWIHRI